jgi:hypothetical protein
MITLFDFVVSLANAADTIWDIPRIPAEAREVVFKKFLRDD